MTEQEETSKIKAISGNQEVHEHVEGCMHVQKIYEVALNSQLRLSLRVCTKRN